RGGRLPGGNGSAETVSEGGDQLAVRGVPAELPEEGARQALVPGVGCLAADGGRGVVAPPLVTALGVGGAGDGAVGRALVLEDLVVLDPGLVGAGRGAGGGPARRGLSDAGPPAAVEPDAQQQLARGHALGLQLRRSEEHTSELQSRENLV